MVSIKEEKINQFKTTLDWGQAACEALMKKFEAPLLPPENKWHYHQGVFLYGLQELSEKKKDDRYSAYIKAYVDSLIDENGNFLFDRKELDSIQAGLLLFEIEKQTTDQRYRIAADKLLAMFPTLNKTTDGGYWHKDRYPYQMWLDGLYMGGVFALHYGKEYGDPSLLDMVVEQEALMRKHTFDEETGLYFHAWDESRKTPWSNEKTGKSPEFWGRAIGWYGMALNEILEFLPEDHPERPKLLQALRNLVQSLINYQDEETGLWYQVVDKGDREDNWLETSCSSLFVYMIAKGVKNQFLDESLIEFAKKGFQGLIDQIEFTEDGLFVLPGICIGTGVGDYEHYINRPKTDNDLHGVGAFVLASVEMSEFW
ncbi:glycoside hydrolase family 88/105 protein [Jeotgalibacillus soli]|uniref:Glycosyl hydrolase family 88 n=1 Tax=Jeotgalibacillus soli TaxID=889306 RepID=A0A0C2RPF5_9BACL|nr:glycoside hydrolase family 88 protein [Jeotgalibacillus soli]KIL52145.1 glycosyl hydrolase family 88 [Jeotgalibacillus soli]